MKVLLPEGALGRPSALVALCCVALCAGVAPVAAADPLAALGACRAIDDPTARLACFDRESAALVTPEKGGALAPDQKFGLSPPAIAAKEAAAGVRPTDLPRLEARLASLRVSGDGRLVFTLDNGQVWQQLVPGDDLLLTPGDSITLLRGALGSFWLRASSGRGCKVTRLR